jgi:hypothetical protein
MVTDGPRAEDLACWDAAVGPRRKKLASERDQTLNKGVFAGRWIGDELDRV